MALAGAITALLSVLLGAFGAHGLKSILSPDMLGAFETGVRYQMFHALGVLLVALLSLHVDDRRVRAAGWWLLAGIILFSGSLYLMALTGERRLGIVTPLGGTAFLVGWSLLALGLWRRPG
jgi:uncharacterized membrane protein YgdD (TMEM256/DUF423 family)